MPRSMLKNYNLESRLFNQRIIVTAIFMAVLCFLIIVRLFYLQVFEHGMYTTLSNNNQMSLIPIEPNRGLIYDRNGVLLAKNVPSFSLDITPSRVDDLPQTLLQLQDLLGFDDELIEQFNKHRHQHRPFDPVPLKFKLSEQELAKFYVNQYRFTGVMINARMTRNYPLGADMVSALGYVGRINERELKAIDPVNYSASNFIGKIGVERFYEEQLHGAVGYQQVEVNASGQIIRRRNTFAPVPGDDIVLTIDSKIQSAAHKALGDQRGSVVCIDPTNGDILALVSHPSFDPNLFVNGISTKDFQTLQKSPTKPLYNRAIRGQYPLASTIKPFTGLAGLQYEVIKPDSYIQCKGFYKLPNIDHVYRDWNWRRHGHGWTNLVKAITVSCDPYFYNLAMKLGIHKMDAMLSQFGFGEPTGIDVKEELSGLLPSPEWKMTTQHAHWYTGDTIISGIGQGFMLTTPLQLASATATLSMKGLRYRPHLLLKSTVANGHEIVHKPVSMKPVQLNKPSYWRIIIHAMHNVIVSHKPWGTGYRFGRNAKYSVAAKTGTAQIYRPAQFRDIPEVQVPLKYRNHSLFIAFAPIEHPKIAIAVVIENNKDAPVVARKVMDAYFNGVKKEKANSKQHVTRKVAVNKRTHA